MSRRRCFVVLVRTIAGQWQTVTHRGRTEWTRRAADSLAKAVSADPKFRERFTAVRVVDAGEDAQC